MGPRSTTLTITISAMSVLRALVMASCCVRPGAELILIAVLAVKVALLVKVDLDAGSGAA